MDTRPLPPWLSSALKTPSPSGSLSGPSIGQGSLIGFIVQKAIKALVYFVLICIFVCLPLGMILSMFGFKTNEFNGMPEGWRASDTPGYQFEFIPQTDEEYKRLTEIRKQNQELLNKRNK